ncbi:hypothetical protein IFM89_034559 [Coptis chinensis]|uniref:Uncharacterized protein n=1 Tax=Coptis chinensis TaxID=261450 RepID=A0A835HP64_9MAGN|nr:hypothetical protein IFM89_034559 [Coptis chinensis]
MVKPAAEGKNPKTLDHPTVRGSRFAITFSPTKINLETLLVEETPRVKPKKPTNLGGLWGGSRRGHGRGRRTGRWLLEMLDFCKFCRICLCTRVGIWRDLVDVKDSQIFVYHSYFVEMFLA